MSPHLTDEDLNCLVKTIQSGMLVQGKEVQNFETNISSFLNCDFSMAVSNGTASLHLALLALGIKNGDEVIVPAFSYVATANAVEITGAKPVFVDIDIKTFNIDVDQIEKAITKKTRAIIPVHEFGLSSEISKITEIARAYNLFVIEDAACALGAMENGKLVGTFGDFGSFSFHPRKAITSGEGGILTTNNKELSAKIKILRNHGIETINGKMEFVEAGYNYRMTDFQAALVNNQLKRLNDNIDYKNKLAETYFQDLNQNKNIILPYVPENKNHTWQTFHILIDKKLNRDQVIEQLKESQIGTNYGAQCIPIQQFYQKKYNLDCYSLFPSALAAYEQGLALPIYEKLQPEDISYISEALNHILK